MPRLLILPGSCDALGGTLVTLSLVLQGFEKSGMQEMARVLVRKDSIMEQYLREVGQANYMQLIPASNPQRFLQKALAWVMQQPPEYPLLLDNCVERPLLPILIAASANLRFSGRSIYHFCHDLALSHSRAGYLLRKLAFVCLSPQAICNSNFTAQHIHQFMPNIKGTLYQPVDFNRFNDHHSELPPEPLQPIIDTGAKIILTPSRINQAGIINDKNLRALIPVLAILKEQGYRYHGVIVGEDRSRDQINTKKILLSAVYAGVSDCLTILPPTFAIEDYYRHADVVVTLAPREPFGRTVVEAIACGVPVIGSNTGGIGEILQQCAPEWAVSPTDPETVVEAILRVTTDLNTPQRLINAQQWVKSQCSITRYVQALTEITGLPLPPPKQPAMTVC
jgi:glycosyltransferase involved in cell wall biosynthesis